MFELCLGCVPGCEAGFEGVGRGCCRGIGCIRGAGFLVEGQVVAEGVVEAWG